MFRQHQPIDSKQYTRITFVFPPGVDAKALLGYDPSLIESAELNKGLLSNTAMLVSTRTLKKHPERCNLTEEQARQVLEKLEEEKKQEFSK